MEYEFSRFFCRFVWADISYGIAEYVYLYDQQQEQYVLLGAIANDYSLAKVG